MSTDMSSDSSKRYRFAEWLERPTTIRKLWWGFGLILAATVGAQLLVHVHAYFGLAEVFGFNAAYGFLTCVAMVLFAKVLGWVLKRPADYYEQGPDFSSEAEGFKPEANDV